MAVYAPPGVLLHVRQGTLVARRFDLTRGVVAGEPIPIAQGIGDTGYGGYPPFRGVFTVSATGVLAYRAHGGERLRRLAWIDRAGVSHGTIGPPFPGYFIGAELSPDGRRVAVDRVVSFDEDVWLLDVKTGVPGRFTFDPKDDAGAVWSADGHRMVFASNRNGFYDLFEKPASAARDEQPLLVTPESKEPLSWSLDGRFILYAVRKANKLDRDLSALPLTGDRKPFSVVQTPAEESWGQFSPDGRWVAYQSNESGRMEVYVQAFPETGGKRQISSKGGSQIRWRPDGRELFYVAADDHLMAAPITDGVDGQLEVGAPVPLFSTKISPYYGTVAQFAVAPDGRFLMNVVVEAPTAPPITVVLNWPAALDD